MLIPLLCPENYVKDNVLSVGHRTVFPNRTNGTLTQRATWHFPVMTGEQYIISLVIRLLAKKTAESLTQGSFKCNLSLLPWINKWFSMQLKIATFFRTQLICFHFNEVPL